VQDAKGGFAKMMLAAYELTRFYGVLKTTRQSRATRNVSVETVCYYFSAVKI